MSPKDETDAKLLFIPEVGAEFEVTKELASVNSLHVLQLKEEYFKETENN